MTFEGRECFASWRSVAIEGNLFYCLACGGSIRCYCDEDAKKVIQGDNRGMDSVHDLEMQALIAAERERCAKVAESCMDGGMDPHNEWDCGIMDACVEIAARIRASGPSRI